MLVCKRLGDMWKQMFAIFNNLLFSSLLDKMKNTITFALEQEERAREREREREREWIP